LEDVEEAQLGLIGDMNKERLAHAKSVGFVSIDLTKHDRLGELVADVLGNPEVDCAFDCAGFEAKAQGKNGQVIEAPAVVLNSLMEITRAAGAIGIPGLYVTDDPGAKEQAAKHGNFSLRLGLTLETSSDGATRRRSGIHLSSPSGLQTSCRRSDLCPSRQNDHRPIRHPDGLHCRRHHVQAHRSQCQRLPPLWRQR
jgi:hypothetical protein